jgi:translation initiation factor 2 alpha subunit (eIF-2alpha)
MYRAMEPTTARRPNMTNSFAIQNLSADGVEQAKKALAKLDNDNAKEILGDAQWAVIVRQ